MRMPSDKEANAPVFEIHPEFGNMAVTMGQATWSIPELTQREKAFACLAADVCVRDIGLPFGMHVQVALANDVPLNHIREVVLQAAIEAGHTGTLMALKRLKEVCAEIGKPLTPDECVSDGDLSFDYFADLNAKDIDVNSVGRVDSRPRKMEFGDKERDKMVWPYQTPRAPVGSKK